MYCKNYFIKFSTWCVQLLKKNGCQNTFSPIKRAEVKQASTMANILYQEVCFCFMKLKGTYLDVKVPSCTFLYLLVFWYLNAVQDCVTTFIYCFCRVVLPKKNAKGESVELVLASVCADKTKKYQSSSDSCVKAWVSFISSSLSILCKTIVFVKNILIGTISYLILYILFLHRSTVWKVTRGIINRCQNTKYIISLMSKCY